MSALSLPGSSHRLGDPGGVRVRLHGLPRATVPRPDCLSPGRRDGGKHLALLNHVKGSPGGVHVGEYQRGLWWRLENGGALMAPEPLEILTVHPSAAERCWGGVGRRG